jgi:hypothetical protein
VSKSQLPKLWAREIVRAAKRHGIKMERSDADKCVRGVLSAAANLSASTPYYHCSGEIAKAYGVDQSVIKIMESGFEGWGDKENSNRYYKIGQNIARLTL